MEKHQYLPCTEYWTDGCSILRTGDINVLPYSPPPVLFVLDRITSTLIQYLVSILVVYPGLGLGLKAQPKIENHTQLLDLTGHGRLGTFRFMQTPTRPTLYFSSSDRIFAFEGETDDVGSLAVRACRCGRCSLAPKLACVGVSARHSQVFNLQTHATANATVSVSDSSFASDPLCVCFSPAKLRFFYHAGIGDLHAEMTS